MYCYLSIRPDENYSSFFKVENFNVFLCKIGGMKKINPLKWKYEDDDLWLHIALIKCNREGSYSYNDSDSYTEFNLIQMTIYLKNNKEKTYKKYMKYAIDISNFLHWQVVDDEKDEVLSSAQERKRGVHRH